MLAHFSTAGVCDHLNPAWRAFTGTPGGDLDWTACVHPDDAHRVDGVVRAAHESGLPFDVTLRLRRHDGEYRSVRIRSAPYARDDGTTAGHVATCVELHAPHETDTTKGSFLSLVAHELRTPLTSILAYFEVLRRSTDRERLLTTSLVDRLSAQMNRFSSLVDELADAARWNDRQSLDLTAQDLDLRELVGETVELFADSARLDGFKPRHFFWFSALGSYHVHGDRRRLGQMIWHLLDNAVKFSPAGGRIEVELDGDGDAHRLRVSDEGIGVPPEDVERLGRAYFRARNASTEQYPGIGLGLAITREIAERHGGGLSVESRLGLGTTVTVTLPATSAPPESEARGAA